MHSNLLELCRVSSVYVKFLDFLAKCLVPVAAHRLAGFTNQEPAHCACHEIAASFAAPFTTALTFSRAVRSRRVVRKAWASPVVTPCCRGAAPGQREDRPGSSGLLARLAMFPFAVDSVLTQELVRGQYLRKRARNRRLRARPLFRCLRCSLGER